MKKPKVDREYPSLSILCSMYGAALNPDGMNGYYGTFGTQQCEQYNAACQELGHRVHTALEEFELGKKVCAVTDKREAWMTNLMIQWITESGMKAVDCAFSENGKAIEVKLDSKLLNFSCRVDRVVTFGKDPTKWVGDYKTSSEMSEQYKMQLAGYALGWFERTGEWIDQGFLLRAEKKPKAKKQLEILPVYDLHKWLVPLTLLRQLWDFQNHKGEWINAA